MFHERTKNIDVKYHDVRDIVEQGKLKECMIGTHDNPAAKLTKPIPIAKFELCSDFVGITQVVVGHKKCLVIVQGEGSHSCYKMEFVSFVHLKSTHPRCSGVVETRCMIAHKCRGSFVPFFDK